MTTTANLGLTLLEVGQKEKEATINTNMSLLDASAQKAEIQTITYAATIAPNGTAAISKCTLTGNVTVNLPTSRRIGRKITLFLKQDGTGNRTVTWATGYKVQNGLVPSTTANKTDIFTLIDDGTDVYVSADKGFD